MITFSLPSVVIEATAMNLEEQKSMDQNTQSQKTDLTSLFSFDLLEVNLFFSKGTA